MTNRETIYIVLGAISLLLIGTGIYFFFRSPIIAFTILQFNSKESIICNTNNPIIYLGVFCLPDALWYMSLLLIQTFFFKETGWLNRLLVGIAISLPFLWEIGQYLCFVSGTFDWFDIITYFLTLILFLCLRKTFLLSPYKSL